VTPTQTLRSVAAAIGAALVLAVAATAAPRDLDRGFGDDGATLTSVGIDDAAIDQIARQPDGKIVAVGTGLTLGERGVKRNAIAIARYLANGTIDRTFGGGDGIVLDRLNEEGSGGRNVVMVQPDGKIVVSGINDISTSLIFVARYLPDGRRDPGFGQDGWRGLRLCCDGASPGAIAMQSDGRILVAGRINNTFTGSAFVARLTTDGDMDDTYGFEGVAEPNLSDAFEHYEAASGLVIQDGKAVIAGEVMRSSGGEEPGPVHVMLARLDENGELDESFGSHGWVDDPILGDHSEAVGLAQRDGKLIVAGNRPNTQGPPENGHHRWFVARYLHDGERDTTFNADSGTPGHLEATVGSDDNAAARGPKLGPPPRARTLTGDPYDEGTRKLFIVRYGNDGEPDPTFQSTGGNVGARLLAAGDGSETYGQSVLLDSRGGTVIGGAANDGDRLKFLLARFGDFTPRPNARPAARIRGHHFVPRKRWVRFDGFSSFDTDGRIVQYAWRTGDRPFRPLGPVFWHRFGRRGVHVLQLRVRDDRGAVAVATFRVNVRGAQD
jgi:uncharacterized delta-60 repeat protein